MEKPYSFKADRRSLCFFIFTKTGDNTFSENSTTDMKFLSAKITLNRPTKIKIVLLVTENETNIVAFKELTRVTI